MKLWILSDLHLEQSVWDLPDPRPDYDVLVAAGDIHFATDAVRWLFERAGGKPVIYVAGNHEWYSYSRKFTMEAEAEEARYLSSITGVDLLENEEVRYGDVRFLGTSLWTDFALDGDTDGAMESARRSMNDYRLIHPREGSRLDPGDTRAWHLASRAWLTERVKEKPEGIRKTVVVTHHLPHRRSIAPRFEGAYLNGAFASDLSDLVEGGGADLWIHGHTHVSCDYVAGGCRVIANPKGYGPRAPGAAIENERFDPRLVIEI